MAAIVVPIVVGMLGGIIVYYVKSNKPKNLPTGPSPEPTVKMTLDQYEARTQAKIDLALAERDKTAPENLTLKNAQIAKLFDRLAKAEQSFAEQQEFVADLEERLDREGNAAGGDALQNAKDALEAGDTKAAQNFFENIKAEKALDVDASARASFALGEIAEQDRALERCICALSGGQPVEALLCPPDQCSKYGPVFSRLSCG